MPQMHGWYIDGFFKNYYFSKSGGIGGIASLGYAKRVRFRFKINSTPFRMNHDLNLTQKKLSGLMKFFNHWDKTLGQMGQFQFHRVWSIHEINKSLDLGIFSTSAGKAIQISFRKAPENFKLFDVNAVDLNLMGQLHSSPALPQTHKTLRTIELYSSNDSRAALKLSQVRIKFEKTLGAEFSIVSAENSHTFEFHYKRGN